jgi:glycosyltransferase involved in cell wall biosynthesis
MHKQLDIVITHYDEPFELVRPGLDMLRNQKGLDFNKFRVRLIHDGSPKFRELENEHFPFDFQEIEQQHKGVSYTRNHGIDLADAEWITFFDCDDSLSSMFSLSYILSGLSNNRFNFIWHPFFVTNLHDSTQMPFTIDIFNVIWMCSKYFRLDFLRKNGIRFNEELQYSEDGAFAKVVYLNCKEDEIGKMNVPFPVYTWIRRMGSATMGAENFIRNNLHGFRSNRYISNEFIKHGKVTSRLMICRTITDCYTSLTQKRMADYPEEAKQIRDEVIDFMAQNKTYLDSATQKEWDFVLDASIGEATTSGLINPDREPFDVWYKKIKGEADAKAVTRA